jgi:hypothetical protein
MTAMGNVPNQSFTINAVRAWHKLFAEVRKNAPEKVD